MSEVMGVDFPGDMFLGDPAGGYIGVEAAFVPGEGPALVTALRDFFTTTCPRAQLIREVPLQGGLLVYYTKKMTDEDLAEFDEVSTEVNTALKKRREERNKAKVDQQERENAQRQEFARLAALGKRCELEHTHLFKEARAERKASRKGAKDAQ